MAVLKNGGGGKHHPHQHPLDFGHYFIFYFYQHKTRNAEAEAEADEGAHLLAKLHVGNPEGTTDRIINARRYASHTKLQCNKNKYRLLLFKSKPPNSPMVTVMTRVKTVSFSHSAVSRACM